MISIRQRSKSMGRGRLAIASLMLLAASGIALVEGKAKERISQYRGHEELIERDLANGELAQLLSDSALVVQRTAPTQLPEALASLHTRRVRAEQRIQRAENSVEIAFDRAHAERITARLLRWFSYAAAGLVVLLWGIWIATRARS